jgi:glycine/D-amino acid oxidase-like deaminating enzyme/nitrite reductase/ring-hydroxylating ferredoxin subunit
MAKSAVEADRGAIFQSTTIMKNSGTSRSIWMETARRPDFTALDRDTEADVIVVGAGIAGLTTAYLLGREGRTAIVLDGGLIASGESERTTAHLASAMDDRFIELERRHGAQGARLAAESHAAAIARIEAIVTEERIACGFERLDGYLFAPPHGSRELLESELAAAHRAGLSDAELVARAPWRTFNTGPALRFPNQAQFHPLHYLSALAAAVVRDGGKIHAHTQVVEIEGKKRVHVRTADGHSVTANAIVIATNSPINDRVVLHTKQMPYRTYVIGAPVPAGEVPRALYWDTADPYHYVRLADGSDSEDILIIGGEDHRTGQDKNSTDRHARLERWARERFPIRDVSFRWSGQVMEPVDCLAFIGRNPADHDNVFVATGDSGQGMTHGTLAGMIISDLIGGRSNPWSDLYDPSRKSALRDAVEFLRDGANLAGQYAKWITAGEVGSETEVRVGCGAIIRRGASKVALYRDNGGQLHECSAVCPHLGGIVSWNDAEKTWDCPVHGSRFDPYGKVVNGPAKSDLQATSAAAKP